MSSLPDELVRHVATYSGLRHSMAMAHTCSTWRNIFDMDVMSNAFTAAMNNKHVIEVLDAYIAEMQSVFESVKQRYETSEPCPCSRTEGVQCMWSSSMDNQFTHLFNALQAVLLSDDGPDAYPPLSFKEMTFSRCVPFSRKVSLALYNLHSLKCPKRRHNSLVVFHGYANIANDLRDRIVEAEQEMTVLRAYRKQVDCLLTPGLPYGAFGVPNGSV